MKNAFSLTLVVLFVSAFAFAGGDTSYKVKKIDQKKMTITVQEMDMDGKPVGKPITVTATKDTKVQSGPNQMKFSDIKVGNTVMLDFDEKTKIVNSIFYY
jgi:hypothetical protein